MIRVLLVDDEEDALNLLEILLLRIGDVEVAGRYVNPVQAIEALQASPVDAVFLDNEMPGMSGMEAARKMREIRPRLPIVFTTAHAEYAVEAFEIQSTDYLLKPLAPGRLQDAVSRIRQSVSADRADRNLSDATIRCLGGFSIARPDDTRRTMPWKTNKEKEICAFLVHHGEKHVDTALIIESVWPEYDLKNAKTYLYTCLSYLRKSFQEHHLPLQIEKNGSGFALRLNGAVVDAAAFEELLDEILLAPTPDDRLYHKINGMYRGEYLEGCDYHWAEFKRDAINAKYLRVLRSMHLLFRRRGDVVLAEDCLRRILAIAPDSEADGRELIRLHLEEGNRSDALHVYRQLERNVNEQLGVGLEEETIRLYRKMGYSG
jgi:two-component SAPR family response regulator